MSYPRAYLEERKRRFLDELYREYLEEIATLYEQRLALLDDPTTCWLDLDDHEQRILACLEGLMQGGETARSLAEQALASDMEGEVYAATRLLSVNSLDPFSFVSQVQEDGVVAAIANGFCDAPCREGLADWLMQWEGRPDLVCMVAMIAGVHRVPIGSWLMALLPGLEDQEAVVRTIWVLGRLETRSATSLLFSYLKHDHDEVRFTAALALLRWGERDCLETCRGAAGQAGWPLVPLALGATRTDYPLLLQASLTTAPVILGLFGDLRAIDPLIDLLTRGLLPDQAALALYLLSGAPLIEQAQVHSSAVRSVRDALEGRAIGHDEGSERMIYRISRDAATWQVWWQDRGSSFSPNLRYRLGRPLSPSSVVTALEDRFLPIYLRRLIFEEQEILYRCGITMEANFPVATQKQAIHELARQTARQKHTPGAWPASNGSTV